MKPYTLLLHEAKGFPGAVQCASAINALIAEGDLKEGRVECKVEDAYSMRSTPQVIGAALDAAGSWPPRNTPTPTSGSHRLDSLAKKSPGRGTPPLTQGAEESDRLGI